MTPFKAITAAICISISSFAIAQQPKETIDAKAKGILDDVAAKTKTYTSIKAEFESTTEKQVSNTESKQTDKQSGTLQLKGDKFKLEVKGQTIYCDGKTQWTYIKESNEVQINNAPDSKATDNISPVNIFTIYEKGYKYKYEKEDVLNGVKVDVIDLFPLNPDKKSFHTIKLFIDKAKKQIISVKIMNKNGTVNIINLKTFTPNVEMPEPTFIFDKKNYPGVEEVDMR